MFDDLNLEFPDVGFYYLIEKGCGKSTLLYLLSGIDDDYNGTYQINGKDRKQFTEKEIDAFRKEKMSFLFPRSNLLSFLTAEENLKLVTSKISKSSLIDVPKKRSIYGLSGGEELLIALSNKINQKKSICLLDEVTSALASALSCNRFRRSVCIA